MAEEKHSRNYLRWYEEFAVEEVLSRCTVVNQTVGYTARCPGLYRITQPGGERTTCTVEISRVARPVYHVQSSLRHTAWLHAQQYVRPGGEFARLPRTDHAAWRLQLRPDGWSMIPVDTGEWAWDLLLTLWVGHANCPGAMLTGPWTRPYQ